MELPTGIAKSKAAADSGTNDRTESPRVLVAQGHGTPFTSWNSYAPLLGFLLNLHLLHEVLRQDALESIRYLPVHESALHLLYLQPQWRWAASSQ